MQVDFKQIKLTDINEQEVLNSTIHKTIANVIYVNARNLDLVEKAMKINKGEVVELSPGELTEIIKLVSSHESGIAAFARKQVKEYLESLK